MIDTSAAIREIRREAKLNQRTFAERIEVSAPHLCTIESGRHNPGPDVLRRIAAEFRGELDALGLALTWESRPTGFERVA